MKQVQIHTKTRMFRGTKFVGVPTEVIANIEPARSIHMVGTYGNGPVDITFNVGDTAEYDSYNLKYLGTITKISDKSVTIQPKYGDQVRRLDLNEFMWRNHDFNLEKVSAENAATRMYI